ncbi:unnamed protein product [Cylicocyclus nassatus]|uniref:Sialate O-acetylesterase domain-containing protein n=1 Tax=Cylicocyclus nassatus TaxID=53992 RepID=A0AA36DSU5_CYLNA|nr:unnamed protein product [Cylicocyclus nassatus]CAJ0592367.1 unnamed protein product [Cylicocyclus nassatus]
MDSTLLMIIPVLVIAAILIISAKTETSGTIFGKILAVGISLILVVGILIPAVQNSDVDYSPLSPAPKENVLDVFLLAGQSNAAYGVYEVSEAAPAPEYGTSYYFGTSTNPVYFLGSTIMSGTYSLAGMGAYDMCNTSGTPKIGNVELPFAGEYTQYSGHDMYMINCGVSGTSISDWQPGEYCYTYALDVFTTAMEQIDVSQYSAVNLCSILWIQGENDAYMIATEYVDLFLTMWASMQTWEYSSQHFEQIIISQTRYASAPNSSIAQKMLGDGDYSGVYLGCTLANSFSTSSGSLVADGIDMKLINGVLTIVVAIILVAVLVVPVIDSEADSVTTTYANGSGTLAQALETTPAAHTIEYTSGTTFTVDGETYQLGTYGRLGIFASDECSLQLNSSGGQIYIMQKGINQITATLSDGFKVETTASGSVTITYGSSTITHPYSWTVMLNPQGTYVWNSISSGNARYIYDVEDIIVAYSFVSGNNYCTYVDGVAKVNGNSSAFTATTAEVEGTDGKLQTVNKLMFGEFEIQFGYVPVTVSYIDAESSQIISLLYIIPLLLLVSVVVIATGFMRSRN